MGIPAYVLVFLLICRGVYEYLLMCASRQMPRFEAEQLQHRRSDALPLSSSRKSSVIDTRNLASALNNLPLPSLGT